jgi:hypothetical protein
MQLFPGRAAAYTGFMRIPVNSLEAMQGGYQPHALSAVIEHMETRQQRSGVDLSPRIDFLKSLRTDLVEQHGNDIVFFDAAETYDVLYASGDAYKTLFYFSWQNNLHQARFFLASQEVASRRLETEAAYTVVNDPELETRIEALFALSATGRDLLKWKKEKGIRTELVECPPGTEANYVGRAFSTKIQIARKEGVSLVEYVLIYAHELRHAWQIHHLADLYNVQRLDENADFLLAQRFLEIDARAFHNVILYRLATSGQLSADQQAQVEKQMYPAAANINTILSSKPSDAEVYIASLEVLAADFTALLGNGYDPHHLNFETWTLLCKNRLAPVLAASTLLNDGLLRKVMPARGPMDTALTPDRIRNPVLWSFSRVNHSHYTAAFKPQPLNWAPA